MKRLRFVLISSVLLSGASITTPRDPARYQQAAEAVQAALSEGNYSTEMREFRRLLELHPNDPQIRAQFYLAMGSAAEKAGEAKDAGQYKSLAHALDLGIDARVAQSGVATRGDKGDMAIALMGAAMQSFAAIQKARDDAKMRRAMMQPQPQQQQFQPPQQPQPVYNYPQASANAQGYAPPTQYQPMPGYAPDTSMSGAMPMAYGNAAPQGYPPPVAGQQLPTQYPAAQPPPAYPQAQPSPQSQGGPPVPPQYPAAQPPPSYPPAQPAQQSQQYPPSQGPQPPQFQTPGPNGRVRAQLPDVSGAISGGMSGGPSAGYAHPADPYVMRRQMADARQYTRRGEVMKPMRVVHDHSLLGDNAYFESGCAALLTVEDGELIFTSSSEAPRAIAAAEILEIGMNLEVGRAIGAFHILTKRGLYLNLAPEASTREEGREFVKALRKQLGLGE